MRDGGVVMNDGRISWEKCPKSCTVEVSCVVGCGLEWRQQELGSGAGQSSARRGLPGMKWITHIVAQRGNKER